MHSQGRTERQRCPDPQLSDTIPSLVFDRPERRDLRRGAVRSGLTRMRLRDQPADDTTVLLAHNLEKPL
jgi:hypothetical protein